MENIVTWLPWIIAVVAILVAFWYSRSLGEQETLNLEGVLEAAEGGLQYAQTEGAEFVREITPAAITIVKGLRQMFKNGELELDELKPKALAQLREMFPHVDEQRLELALEGAVFGAKWAFKELWKRQGDGEVPAAESLTGTSLGVATANATGTLGGNETTGIVPEIPYAPV